MLNTGIIAAVAAFCTFFGSEDGDIVRVYADGERTDIYESAYVEENSVYVPLQEVGESLGAVAVVWSPESETMELEAPGLFITATVGDEYMEANGRFIYLPGGVQYRFNRVMVPADGLALAFGAELTYLPKVGAVCFTSGTPIESGEGFYDEDDVYWLSRLIQAEAGGESMRGKISVGSVVMNRVASGDFPNTVEKVIFDSNCGIQFSPAYNGAIYNTPSDDSVIAAKLALDGARPVGDCLYFSASYLSDSCWAARTMCVYETIGRQTFYTSSF